MLAGRGAVRRATDFSCRELGGASKPSSAERLPQGTLWATYCSCKYSYLRALTCTAESSWTVTANSCPKGYEASSTDSCTGCQRVTSVCTWAVRLSFLTPRPPITLRFHWAANLTILRAPCLWNPL